MSTPSYFVCCVRVNPGPKSWGPSSSLEGEDQDDKDEGEEEQGEVGLDYALLSVACGCN